MPEEKKERPMLFNGDMVRAVMSGQKTVTRRALNAQALKNIGYGAQLGECHELPKEGPLHPNSIGYYNDFCPYGQPGDRLWVRESTEAFDSPCGAVTLARYRADKAPVMYLDDDGGEPIHAVAHWSYPRYVRPSIHMTRAQARILLEITAVRVERLHTITNAQCIAEGCRGGHGSIPGYIYNATPQEHFRHIWESTGGDYFANPWVWVVEFKRVMP